MLKTLLNKIGFYQFDNLVQGRIPFCFINMGDDLADWYSSIYKTHIQTHQIRTTLDQAEKILIERHIPKDFAILIVCQNGLQSETLATYLQKNGYTNVYLIDGGIQQMMTERSSLC